MVFGRSGAVTGARAGHRDWWQPTAPRHSLSWPAEKLSWQSFLIHFAVRGRAAHGLPTFNTAAGHRLWTDPSFHQSKPWMSPD
jgi:hypothetical protein